MLGRFRLRLAGLVMRHQVEMIVLRRMLLEYQRGRFEDVDIPGF